jgi:hypothetical protein
MKVKVELEMDLDLSKLSLGEVRKIVEQIIQAEQSKVVKSTKVTGFEIL